MEIKSTTQVSRNQQERISCWTLSSQLAQAVATSISALAQECCYLGQTWIIIFTLVKLEREEVFRRGKFELEGKAGRLVWWSSGRGAEQNQVLEEVLSSTLEKAHENGPAKSMSKRIVKLLEQNFVGEN